MNIPTVLSIVKAERELEKLRDQRSELRAAGKSSNDFEAMKVDIRIEQQRQLLIEMRDQHSKIYPSRFPTAKSLASLNPDFRRRLIHSMLRRAQVSLEECMNDIDVYETSLAQKELQRVELLARAFSEVDNETPLRNIDHCSTSEQSEDDIIIPSIGREYMELRDFRRSEYTTLPTDDPEVPDDIREEVLAMLQAA